jgi:hypothetical protein
MIRGLQNIDFEIGAEGGLVNYVDDIISIVKPSNGFVIELGVYTGRSSTVAIQQGLVGNADPLHISVDIEDRMTWEPDVPWWHKIIADDRLPETRDRAAAIAGNRKAGVIYIDTVHGYDQMKAELELWSVLADDQTEFLFHDTWEYGSYNVRMNIAIIEFASATGREFIDWRQDMHGLGRMRSSRS